MNKVATLSTDIKGQVSESAFISEKGNKSEIFIGYKKNWWHFRICLTLSGILMKNYRNPLDWLAGFKYLYQLRKKFFGNFRLKKIIKVDDKYYMGLYTPGWNDINYKRFIASELNHFKPSIEQPIRFNHVHLAITKKCALQCDHCYAWDILNQKDVLNEEDLMLIVNKLQTMGTCQIHLTGGEPMLKLNTLTNLLENTSKTTNFWINTSGFKLTYENAERLKSSGLTGVFISLDHFEEAIHNDFRKFKDAYYWATQGAENAVANNLVVALSICVTNDFISETNLKKYMELAKSLGVHFVQFLEPKAVGHFKGKDVALTKGNINILESFYAKMNFSNDFLNFPIINYHGYYQRRQGCFAGGNRSMYVDTDGNINACTFCHTNSGNIMSDDFDFQLKEMSKKGCPSN